MEQILYFYSQNQLISLAIFNKGIIMLSLFLNISLLLVGKGIVSADALVFDCIDRAAAPIDMATLFRHLPIYSYCN